jgi:glycosyltransferase involved in cell wall biosynthesis
MDIAVIIPSLNSPIIDRVIESLLQQEPADIIREILIVGKDEPNLIRPSEKVRFIDTGRPVSAGRARNIGIEACSAEVLLFLDSDCIPEADCVAQHLIAHREGHEVVGGGVLPKGREHWHTVYNLSLFNSTLTTAPAGPRMTLPTMNLSVRRHVIEKAGPLREDLRRCEDMEWIQRMRVNGYTATFWPKAVVLHEHGRCRIRAVLRDFVRTGRESRAIRREHGALLGTPRFLTNDLLVRLLAPAIAAFSLVGIERRHPGFVRHYFRYLPSIYLTKLAWCWGGGVHAG